MGLEAATLYVGTGVCEWTAEYEAPGSRDFATKHYISSFVFPHGRDVWGSRDQFTSCINRVKKDLTRIAHDTIQWSPNLFKCCFNFVRNWNGNTAECKKKKK